MKFLLLTYLDEKAWAALGEAEQNRMMEAPKPHVDRLRASGKFLGGAPLHPTSEAATVKLRGGKPVVTDGPFAETREQLGGYTLIEAGSREEAIDIAAGFFGTSSLPTIEVRQVLELPWVPAH